MSKANEPAFPGSFSGIPGKIDNTNRDGLTKREYFAAMAMQGLSSLMARKTHVDVARHAVDYADALLAELEKPNGG
jgi:hypothetical protein